MSQNKRTNKNIFFKNLIRRMSLNFSNQAKFLMSKKVLSTAKQWIITNCWFVYKLIITIKIGSTAYTENRFS